MKMKTKGIIVLIVLTALLPGAFTAQEVNKVIIDKKLGTEVLSGYLNRDGLKGEVFGRYYEEEYRQYEPDQKIIEILKKLPSDWEATIVLGSWCSDSQREVPRFFRILDEAGIDEQRLTLVGVDRAKEARGLDLDELGVERVPTFIFYRKGKEMGRITETPAETLEKDMLIILARPPAPATPSAAPPK